MPVQTLLLQNLFYTLTENGGATHKLVIGDHGNLGEFTNFTSKAEAFSIVYNEENVATTLTTVGTVMGAAGIGVAAVSAFGGILTVETGVGGAAGVAGVIGGVGIAVGGVVVGLTGYFAEQYYVNQPVRSTNLHNSYIIGNGMNGAFDDSGGFY